MKRTEYKDKKYPFNFVCYSPEKKSEKLPLIVQLHGAGERGEDLSLVDVHGFSKMFNNKDYPCIAIMPQCPRETFWAARVESLIKFIEQIISEFNVDADKVYLTGLSMGGFGTWYTAMAKPELFAAIAPVCGGGMPWNAHTLKMPVWAFHGALDTTVTPRNSDEMIEALEKTNKETKYSRVEGVGHNVWNVAYTEDLLEWLLSKKR